jgi:ribonuclease HI
MGIGVILRDCNGEVLATLSAPKEYITAPDIAEATATLRAVYFCQELGFHQVILEGDALLVVQALNTGGTNWCRYGHLLDEAKGILNSFQSWSVQHVRRTNNEAAHCLAKKALSLCEEQVFIEDIPMSL